MAGALSRDTSRGQLLALSFGQINVAASQTDVQLTAADTSGNDHYPMAFPGDVVAIAWSASAAVTAGTCTLGATFDGTEDADTTLSVPADSTTTAGKFLIPRGKAPFAANTKLGVEISTNSGFLPITTDISVVVYVLVDVDGI